MNIQKTENNPKRTTVRCHFALEPAYFVLYYGYNLTCAVKQNQLLKQGCLLKGLNLTDCVNLTNLDIEEDLQREVATINMSTLLLNSLFPGIFSLILGSWSDLYGRRKVLLTSYTGYSLTLGLIAACTYISDHINTLSPWVYFFAEIPMTLLGGWPALDIAVTCYVTDLTSAENRSFRLGIIGFLNFLGTSLAYFSSSYILAITNLTIIHTIGFSCVFLALLWVVSFVDDSIEPFENVSGSEQFKQIFSTSRIKEIFSSLCKQRPLKCRRTLWALIAIPSLILFTMHGNGTLNYMFVRQQFGWTLREWTTYESVNNVLSVTGMFIGVMVLKKLLQISDMKLGVLGLVSLNAEALIKSFATKGNQLYIAAGTTTFRLLSFPMFRSMANLITPHEELGKVYSLMTCLGALSGICAGPLYVSIYNATITFFAGAFNLLTTGVVLTCLVLSGFISRWNFLVSRNDKPEDLSKVKESLLVK